MTRLERRRLGRAYRWEWSIFVATV